MRLYECRLEKGTSSAQPGQVVAIDGETLSIAAPGGTIIAKKRVAREEKSQPLNSRNKQVGSGRTVCVTKRLTGDQQLRFFNS